MYVSYLCICDDSLLAYQRKKMFLSYQHGLPPILFLFCSNLKWKKYYLMRHNHYGRQNGQFSKIAFERNILDCNIFLTLEGLKRKLRKQIVLLCCFAAADIIVKRKSDTFTLIFHPFLIVCSVQKSSNMQIHNTTNIVSEHLEKT